MPDYADYSVVRYQNRAFTRMEIPSVREIPLTIFLNGREVVTLLCTGKHPLYLTMGFLKSDAYVRHPDQVEGIDVHWEDDRILVTVQTSHDPWKNRRVESTVTSGCGKGTNFGRNLATISQRRLCSTMTVAPDDIMALVAELHDRSSLYRHTRGCHNSSLCTVSEMLIFREDIGRHNAIDMIVGQCFMEGVDTWDKMIVTTGRVASEILLKTVRIGVPVLVSSAAATSLAVELARKTGLTLVGKASKDGFSVYNDPGRILGLQAASTSLSIPLVEQETDALA